MCLGLTDWGYKGFRGCNRPTCGSDDGGSHFLGVRISVFTCSFLFPFVVVTRAVLLLLLLVRRSGSLCMTRLWLDILWPIRWMVLEGMNRYAVLANWRATDSFKLCPTTDAFPYLTPILRSVWWHRRKSRALQFVHIKRPLNMPDNVCNIKSHVKYRYDCSTPDVFWMVLDVVVVWVSPKQCQSQLVCQSNRKRLDVKY